ncbi:hypothetical protein FNV43_RR15224 [Rhamnella rubrinervis]|uniref:Uncharacterized protein n=1 Tax=Rhamnella rubrinervis TaxID=2594499 RepID=A0A8K0GX09_9ROSA|nr:hypothetical protein FNV43_RR15224 [Rhamnella rubrinervis]
MAVWTSLYLLTEQSATMVNNAAIFGMKEDANALLSVPNAVGELAEECFQINYYGAKRTAEALIPLLQLSHSSRIVNLSSSMGKLEVVLLESKNRPTYFSAYRVSKAAMNAYTRILAKNYPSFRINYLCPGYVTTDINPNTGVLSVEVGVATPVKLALLPNDGPSGLSFYRSEVSSF